MKRIAKSAVAILLLVGSGTLASANAIAFNFQSHEDRDWKKLQPLLDDCTWRVDEENDGQNDVAHKINRKKACREAAREFNTFITKYNRDHSAVVYVENLFRWGMMLENSDDFETAEFAYVTCNNHSKKNQAQYLGHGSIVWLLDKRLTAVRERLRIIRRMERRMKINP